MTELISFFKQSHHIIDQMSIERGYAGPRNFQSFTYGECNGRLYCIFRDRTIETSQYFLLFSRYDLVSVNVCFPSCDSFEFDADCNIMLDDPEISEPLFLLFEFVVWDAFRKGVQLIFGRFSYDHGTITNEPILHALRRLGFQIMSDVPEDPLCVKWLSTCPSGIEQAWTQAKIPDLRHTRGYLHLPQHPYVFITRKPLRIPNTFLFTLSVASDNFCQLHCRIDKNRLTLSAPLLHSTNLALFPLLLQQINFDVTHNVFTQPVKYIQLLLDNDHGSWMEPVLTAMGFRNNNANSAYSWRLKL